MADDPNWNYWNDILMAWEQLEFRLMATPPEVLSARQRSFVDDWQRITDRAPDQVREFYDANSPPARR